jgi:hypothetical protein
VYEYTLIQAQEDGYLAACEIVRRKASIDWRTFTREEVLAAHPVEARTGRPIGPDDLKKDQYSAQHCAPARQKRQIPRGEQLFLDHRFHRPPGQGP